MCGGSNKATQNSTSTYTPTGQASTAYSNVIDRATTASEAPYDPATGKTIADLNPTQQQAFGQVQGNQGAWQPAVGQAGQMITEAGSAVSPEQIQQYMNPWMSDVVSQTLARINDQDAMATRGYKANQVSQNALGGNGFGLGLGELQGRQSDNRNFTVANLMSGGFDRALGAAQQDKTRGLSAGQSMANLGQLTSQLGYTDANATLQAGNQQQAQQQAQNDAASANAQQEGVWDMQTAQYLAGITGGIAPLMGGTTKSRGQAEQSQGKGIGQMIGTAATVAGMMSDERVKENKRRVGKTFDGQDIWSYNYTGDPRTQIGLMAQEVEQDHPEAVRELGGIKHVNYDQALDDSGEARADGGGVFGGYATAMPWATINPGKPIIPEAPDVKVQQQEGQGADPEAAYKMGEKAGSGLENLWGKIGGMGSGMPAASSPAGGAMAASGMQGAGGGGLNILSGLGSLFGFADGGGVTASPEEMAALEQIESGGRDIVNPKSGAFGPRQIMPATAEDPGFGVKPLDRSITDSKLRLGEQRRFSDDYFNAMLKRYGGDRDAARIAYNGGPRRADNWLKANRDDSVIPRESADYYKKVGNELTPGQQRATSGTDGGNTAPNVRKGFNGSTSGGEKYKNSADRATGGLLKRAFGTDFNPLNLSENERRALMVAGLSMMSNGDIGRGGLMGMQYLTGVEAGERKARTAAEKLNYERSQDIQKQGNWTREQSVREGDAALNRDKQTYTEKHDDKRLSFDEKKLGAELGKPTDDMKEYDAYTAQETAAGRQPLSQMEYLERLKRAGKPETNVSVSGDKKGAEEMSKRYAERYFELGKNSDGAQQIIDNLSQLEGALDTGANTGTFGEWEQAARKFGAALGVADINKVAAGELIQTISNRMALQVRAPGGESGGMPGAMSDADRVFLKETVPNLLKTPGGNRKLINIMKAAASRHQVIHDMAIDYAEENGGQLGPGFDRAVREYVKANPLARAIDERDQPKTVKTEVIGPPKIGQVRNGWRFKGGAPNAQESWERVSP